MAWDSRFWRASHARAHPSPEPRRIGDDVVLDARRRSPKGFLRGHFSNVETTRKGEVISIPGVLRADLWDASHWLSCDWQGGPIGDNLALVRHVLPGTSFPDAVRLLTGAVADAIPQARPAAPRVAAYPRLPPRADPAPGRAYLRGRGISDATMEMAERAGLLRHARDGVLFLGRDHGAPTRSVRSVTVRYFGPQPAADGSLLTKRDFANSDKAFPGLLPGDPATVIVVEGGVNALAAADLKVRAGLPSPTVIVTGGVGVRSWVRRNAHLRTLLADTATVEILGEREGDPAKQEKTDLLRARLQEEIAAETRGGELPAIVYPPEGAADAAEWNLAVQVEAGPGCS